MLINIIVKSIIKILFICLSDTDTSIDFMILILSNTFDMIYSPNKEYIYADNFYLVI